MTAPRPEPEGPQGPSFEAGAEAGRPADPLGDPLPGQHPSPWFRAGPVRQEPAPEEDEWYDPEGYRRDWYGERQEQAPAPRQAPAPQSAPAPPMAPAAPQGPAPVLDDATIGLRTADVRRIAARGPSTETVASAAPDTGPGPGPGSGGGPDGAAPRRPTRAELRRAARARKDGPAVVASRALGEVFITLGVLMLLFVAYQLWWTNVRAGQMAGKEKDRIEQRWSKGERAPGTFEPGQGFAIMHIPELDVVVPVAEGISKTKVLDRGMVGHYAQGKLKTAMPGDKQGNFAVAGHRNTHGEPFRYVNRLKPGDKIVVETQDAYYTYAMASILPQTSPSNVAVIDPVPRGSGFEKPGRYITLTTCTPEFTSTYRMIVWGKMVEERPRSKGKPDALL
ncbi:class E sortase [Streptomyces sp. NPDC050504]|uniref:class E sortase n=1 Tax=Streptomyces sp. NPDC050504 TaxID=3365618 RepID=UPI003788159B